MDKIKIWLSAFRLRTLPLSVSGIILGASFAYYNGYFDGLVFFLAILTTLAYQILSNLANDYGDGIKGTDNEERIGPKRAIQSQAISLEEMEEAIKINVLVAIVLSFSLIFTAFGSKNVLYALLFFVLSGIAIYSSLRYTVGHNAYGYRGRGDIFVFIFFGLVSVIGSYFLFAQQVDHIVFMPAISIGLLSAGVLNLNNIRDIESDKNANKMTLAVKLGFEKAKKYHLLLVTGALVLGLVFSILYYTSIYNFIFLLVYIPIIKHVLRVKNYTQSHQFDPELKILALSTFFFALLLGLGQILEVFFM